MWCRRKLFGVAEVATLRMGFEIDGAPQGNAPNSCESGYNSRTMKRKELKSSLKRLSREFYQGHSYVHWSLSIEDRKTGWLTPVFYYRFREILTHTMFRYQLVCPIYCCMPDHIHLMWIGLSQSTDQLNAMKYFRRLLNRDLQRQGFRLQKQGYDNVLADDERVEDSFSDICQYIAKNPERKDLVHADQFDSYPYLNCLIPGAPEVDFRDDDFWSRFWRIVSSLRSKTE